MQSSNQLQDMLHSINRKSYPAYKSLKGAYQFKKYVLSIDHVQGDPFASPSHVSVKIFHREAGFPAEYYKDKLTRITLADYLTRRFEQQVNRYTFRAKGSGKSGLISVTRCGQEVLEREDAVAELRRLVGNTDPARAAEGTLRRMYGENVTRNAVHASDSVENARMEASRFFREEDIVVARYEPKEEKAPAAEPEIQPAAADAPAAEPEAEAELPAE